jgi:hypothetical protein
MEAGTSATHMGVKVATLIRNDASEQEHVELHAPPGAHQVRQPLKYLATNRC